MKAENFKEFQSTFEIYASLGSLQEGATLEQIAMRSSLSNEICLRTLDTMVKQGICEYDADRNRYKPLSIHPILQGLGASAVFQKWFLDSVDLTKRTAKNNFEDEDKLFSGSVVSVARHRMPEFKVALRDLVGQFVEDIEEPNSNGLARLVVALF